MTRNQEEYIMTEFAWVIEKGDTKPSSPLYLSASWYGWAWSPDHEAATRFAREVDAMEVIKMLHGDDADDCTDDDGRHRAAEHGWDKK